ncbi:membrane protein [Burkholderia lata]|uniref:Membrane protein n=1 Tax=Burkholderia lata (strain ATCC 17760 / DSM 23089 / LMG 22485 / NCIMB 9086 / R18194 / 383) TaxID=482957 RepID=A0A6P2XTR3_BURL3|nr:membrane protein [Burkholderia lata]
MRLPGDASLLVTLMLTFVAETGIHYAVAVHAPWAATSGFVMLSFAVWGMLIGMTLGRATNAVVRCMRHTNGSEHGSFPYSFDPR